MSRAKTNGKIPTAAAEPRTSIRCAIYTRKSSEEGLDQQFNSLDAQRDSAEAYIESQCGEGWVCLPERYDDGGYSGGNMERPALKRLLSDVEAGKIDVIVVYKIDRLSRSIMDFGRIAELLEQQSVSFVSVTQHINTSTSAGRLMLHVLLSFSQYERELVSERTRDKIAASRRKGIWSGGHPVLGYDMDKSQPGGARLIVNDIEADQVRDIFRLYLERGSLLSVAKELNARGWCTKAWNSRQGRAMGGKPYTKNRVFNLLTNQLLRGKVTHKGAIYEGQHESIVPQELWNSVQMQLEHNRRAGGVQVRNKHGALLKGLIRCAPCNRAMQHSHTRKGNRLYRYYICGSAQQKGWHTCPSKSVPAAEIEKFVVEQIRAIGHDPALVAATIEATQVQQQARLDELERDHRIVERELKRSGDALISASDNTDLLADLIDRIAGAEQRLRGITDEVATLERGSITEEEVIAALDDFDTLWEAMTLRERCRIFRLLIQRLSTTARKARSGCSSIHQVFGHCLTLRVRHRRKPRNGNGDDDDRTAGALRERATQSQTDS